jgi:uncharacterized peroxidase-related enzyme
MQDLDWEDCLIPQRRDPETERVYREKLGVVPHAAYYLSWVGWINRAVLELSVERDLLTELGYELNQFLWLAVSQDASCRYCFAAHRGFLRLQGHPESRIRRLEQDFFAAELDPRERLAIDFARRLSRANPMVTWRDTAPLREAGFSEAAVKEIAFSAASVVFANRTATLPALPPEPVERAPDRWSVRLLRPLVERRLRARRRPGRPAPLPPEMRTGPFQAWVDGLAPLPVAGVLWRILDGAFASPGIGERARALIFAVVARGLGCARTEAEAVRHLLAAGFPASEVETTLAHLASDALDGQEAVLVPFARETIRYGEAAPLQRRARSVLARVGRGAFGEFVGLAGLANMVGRLSFLAAPV